MGYGNYSHAAHEALIRSREQAPVQEVFKQRGCHPMMNPHGVKMRESRDSAQHPNSLGIAFALDVTGSMGKIPHLMATKLLPNFMKILMDVKVADPQVLFMAVGDASSDQAPLQVGQFESAADLMDKWLTWVYLEGRGGPGNQESYELGLYFLAMHTAMDCWQKRGKKGYMFMTGDELPYRHLPKRQIGSIIGDSIDDDLAVEGIVAELQKTFHPFFIIPDENRRRSCERPWRDLLGENVLCLESPEDVCFVAAGAVALSERVATLDALARVIPKSAVRSLKSYAEVLA